MTRKVTLVRHGRPSAEAMFSALSPVTGADLGRFLRAWNECELSDNNPIPQSLRRTIADGDHFVASRLRRTSDSFRLLGVATFELSALFDEAELPFGIGQRIRMPLILWATTVRLLWAMGCHGISESHVEFRKRIALAADFLGDPGTEARHMVVMAHGLVNRFLRRELLKRQWRLASNTGGHSYWSFTTFEKTYGDTAVNGGAPKKSWCPVPTGRI